MGMRSNYDSVHNTKFSLTDSATGERLGIIKSKFQESVGVRHSKEIFALAVSTDGKYLVSVYVEIREVLLPYTRFTACYIDTSTNANVIIHI